MNETNAAASTALLLGRDGGWWDFWMIASLIFVAIAAATVVVFTAGSVVVHKREAVAASDALERYKLATDGELSKQKTLTAQADARAFEAQVALEKFRAPRTFSPEQLAAISAAAAQHNGTAIDIFLAGDSADIRPLSELLARLVKDSGHWQPGVWAWTGVGPIQGLAIIVKKGASPGNVAAATALLRAIDGNTKPESAPEIWPNDWASFGGMLNGPPFEPTRSEIRVVIGSKPQ